MATIGSTGKLFSALIFLLPCVSAQPGLFSSWDLHQETYIHPVNSEDYKVAWDYDNGDELFTKDDPRHPPSYVETRCWIDYDPDSEDKEGFYDYEGIDSNGLDDTVPCTLIGKQEIGGNTFYQVTFFDEEKGEEVKVKGVEWGFITYVDKKLTGNQHLRQGFRHFIELPDEMIPPSWRDMNIGIEDNSECGMYLAESAIPHSGLGMYTARAYDKGERIGFGDLVLQVEDILDNKNLRLWHNGDHNRTIIEKEWLLEHYYWTAESSMAQFDAGFIESMVPGFGMLANSHTGTSHRKPPSRMLVHPFSHLFLSRSAQQCNAAAASTPGPASRHGPRSRSGHGEYTRK